MRDTTPAEISAAAAAGLGSLFTSDVTTPFLGVPLNVVLVAAFGALVAVGLGEKIVPRRKMFGVVLASMTIGALAVTALPHVPGFGWTTNIPQAPLGGLLGFWSRWLVPAIIERVPVIMDRFFPGDKR